MNAADYAIIAVLLLSALLGFFRGFLRESISVICWLGGLWLAWRYSYLVTPLFGGALVHEPVRTWVARALIVAAVVFIGWVVSGLLSYFVHQSGLSLMLDRLLGMLFGLIRGAVLIAVFVILSQLVQLNNVHWWQRSRLMPYAEEFSRWVRNFADSAIDELKARKSAEA